MGAAGVDAWQLAAAGVVCVFVVGAYVMAKNTTPMPTCKIEGCNKPAKRRASCICSMHLQRISRYGDVHYVTPRDKWLEACRKSQTKPAKPSTYKKLYGRHEHRVIAEQILGRPLERGEIVHHIDGNKHNNHPSNLQVMSQADHTRAHHAEMWIARKIKYGYAI